MAQFRVFDEDGLRRRVDFAYPELRLAIEYDGAWHGERRARDDRRRLNRLYAAGWLVLHVTAADMRARSALARHPRLSLAGAQINTG